MAFFIPGSMSSEYVSSKRDELGSNYYEGQIAEVGLQKQAALQQLGKNYSQAIDNAYSSYLAANRGVNMSNMGQGYKELYKEAQEQQLMSNVLSSTEYLQQQRAQLNQQEAAAQSQIQQAYKTEVEYFDTLQQMFANYYDYVKGLTTEGGGAGESYFNETESQQSINSMYEILANAKPQAYKDAEGLSGLVFSDWVRKNYKNSDWYQWFLTSGYHEFMNAPKSVRQLAKNELSANNSTNNVNIPTNKVNVGTGSGTTRTDLISSDINKADSSTLKNSLTNTSQTTSSSNTSGYNPFVKQWINNPNKTVITNLRV